MQTSNPKPEKRTGTDTRPDQIPAELPQSDASVVAVAAAVAVAVNGFSLANAIVEVATARRRLQDLYRVIPVEPARQTIGTCIDDLVSAERRLTALGKIRT